ncbi:unnamed protein product [Acanthoscelides obtectus]|uniref:Uncharacterized protein n=1 Tax=Acanthoscelides obtectus TaxID=200917 RepID=A0A9P0P874_ACAOB|nr:unnamed protein product [Acanthoscelides obtectus]CAK1664730.1 hypothetical protein AOBTE_LOCUS24437 [Acanthoscelides obtectus]
MDNAVRRSWVIVFQSKVLIIFSVEKFRSASDVDIGVVTIISNSFFVSLSVSSKLFCIKNFKRDRVPCKSRQSFPGSFQLVIRKLTTGTW